MRQTGPAFGKLVQKAARQLVRADEFGPGQAKRFHDARAQDGERNGADDGESKDPLEYARVPVVRPCTISSERGKAEQETNDAPRPLGE